MVKFVMKYASVVRRRYYATFKLNFLENQSERKQIPKPPLFLCEVELPVLQPSWDGWPHLGVSTGKKRDICVPSRKAENKAALPLFNTTFSK